MRAESEVERLEQSARFIYRAELRTHALAAAFMANKWQKVDVWEFGVAGGDTIRHIASHHGFVRNVLGFDTFKGLPKDWGPIKQGTFKQEKLPDVPANVTLIVGFFADTLPSAMIEYPRPQVLHIDCDLYEGTMDVLEAFGNIDKGTVIIFDELYNYIGYANHEMKAWLEHIDKYNESYEYIGHVSRLSGIENRGPFQAAVIIK